MGFKFSSESVRRGHPDKVCDQIVDKCLDDILSKDSNARVAIEASAGKGLILVHGEVTTTCYCDVEGLAREVIKEIGYTNPDYGLDYRTVGIITNIHNQSPDIAMGVNKDNDLGAGDQGMMFGFACKETPELMPLPIILAHALVKRVDYCMSFSKDPVMQVYLKTLEKYKNLGEVIEGLRPDGKAQVTVEYDDNENPKRISAVVLAVQHDPSWSQEDLKLELVNKVINPVLQDYIDKDTKIIINGTGAFVKGGPEADSGAIGRKIMVDTYGSYVSHGGGAFSGKDPTKVDRTGAYYARYVAKNLVANGVADKILIQVAYAIGQSEPVSLYVNDFGTSKFSREKIESIIKNNFDFRVKAMIEELDLLKPRFYKTSYYGHFGREEEEFTWERIKELK